METENCSVEVAMRQDKPQKCFSCVESDKSKVNWGYIQTRKHQGVDEHTAEKVRVSINMHKTIKYSVIMHVLTRLWTEWKMQLEILQDSISSAGLNSTMS